MGGIRRRNRILKAGKSPSRMAMERTYKRATLNGGVTQDFSVNVENIREISRKLGYDICNGKDTPRKNLLSNSEGIDSTYWNKFNAGTGVAPIVTANYTSNPIDGAITADRLIIDKGIGTGANDASGTRGTTITYLTIGNTYTHSVWLKTNDGSTVTVQLYDNIQIFLKNVTVTPTWTRFDVTKVATNSNIAVGVVVRGGTSPGTTSQIADLSIYGEQLELGLSPTSYQQTTATGYDNPTAPASFIYVPSSYGEGKNFAQVHNKRNLLQWSESFDNAVWNSSSSAGVVREANVVTNPVNGEMTAELLRQNGVADGSTRRVSHNLSLSGVYTISCYVKRKDLDGIQISAFTTSGHGATFNTTTGAVISTFGSGFNPKSEPLIGGWFRFSVSINTTSITRFDIILTNATGNSSFNNTNTFGNYIWGAQLEQGAYATPYQKTVASGDGIVDFNFTRATSARVTNNLGVIEDSCYNLIQRSEEFDNASWTKESSIATANVISNPVNGSVTADKISINTNSTVVSARLYLGANLVQDNSIKTYSFWVKKAELDFIHFRISQSVNYGFCVDLNTGIITQGRYDGANISTLPTSYSAVKNPDNGWILVTTTFNTTTTINPIIYLATSATTTSVTGQLNNGVYIFGAQLVQSSTPRPYLRTTNRLNVPRLNYSRGTGEPELLIERASTNLFTQSETLTDVSWVKNNTTVLLNSNSNPFGNNKSFYIQETNSSSSHFIDHSASFTSALPYTASWYVKKADDRWVQFFISSTGVGVNSWINFDFDNGVFGNNGGVGTWTKTLLINGYWLITGTATAITTGSGTGAAHVVGTNNTNSAVRLLSYTGATGHNICDVAAVQFEQGASVTTYIPTTTATVTRNAETSYTDLFNNAELNSTNWTLFYEGYLYDGSGTGMSFCLSDTTTAATNTNQIGWDNSLRPFYNIGNSRKNRISEASSNTFNRFVIQYNNGIVNYYVNDINVWSNQSVPVLNYRYLVLNSGGSTFTTDKITLFNRTLTDTECSILTINNIRPDFSMYDVDFQKVLKTAYDNGFVLPNSTKLGIMNQLMIDIKSIGMFSIADTIINPCINDTALGDFARIDWKIPRNVYSSNGGLTYEVSGYKGNSSNAYLGSNYIASNMNQFYTLNNAGRLIVAYSTTTGFLEGSSNTAGAGEGMIGVNSNAQRITTYSSALSPTVSMSGIGTKSINRDDSTNIRIYNNAVETLHTASSTGSSTVEFTVFKRFDSYGNGGASFYYIGGSMSNTMVQNFRTHYNTYLTAIGLTAFA